MLAYLVLGKGFFLAIQMGGWAMKKLTKGQWEVLRMADRGCSLAGHSFIAKKLERKGLLNSPHSRWGFVTEKGKALLNGEKEERGYEFAKVTARIFAQSCECQGQEAVSVKSSPVPPSKRNPMPSLGLRLKLTWNYFCELWDNLGMNCEE